MAKLKQKRDEVFLIVPGAFSTHGATRHPATLPGSRHSLPGENRTVRLSNPEDTGAIGTYPPSDPPRNILPVFPSLPVLFVLELPPSTLIPLEANEKHPCHKHSFRLFRRWVVFLPCQAFSGRLSSPLLEKCAVPSSATSRLVQQGGKQSGVPFG